MLHALWLKIFYVLFKPKVVGKHGKEDIGGVRKAPNIFLEKIKRTKNDIMGAKNINVFVSEN
jgi:hypothetical protein